MSGISESLAGVAPYTAFARDDETNEEIGRNKQMWGKKERGREKVERNRGRKTERDCCSKLKYSLLWR